MEGDLLSRMIFPKDCATSNFRIFLLPFFQLFLGWRRPNYEISLDDVALGISSFFRRLKIISDTFNIQLATRFEAMIEIMKRFNVEIYKTIAVIQSRILLTWTLYRLCFALFFLLEKVLIRWRIKKNYNKLYFPFFPKKKHFKFNNMYFKILGIFILLYQKN